MNLFRRLGGSASTQAAIGLIVGLVTAVGWGAALYLENQGTLGVRTGIAERAGADLALRASLALDDDATGQDAQVRAAIGTTFADTPFTPSVTRTLESHVTVRKVLSLDEEQTESIANTVDESGFAMSIPDFADRAEVVEGALPDSTREVAVQADAAVRLMLEVGDEVLVDGVGFTVVGTWRARDFLDPRWYGSPIVLDGGSDELGPFVIEEKAWDRLDRKPFAVWTVLPDVSLIDSQNIGVIGDRWGQVREGWRGEVDGLQTLGVQNRLVQTLRELQSRLDGLRAVEPVIFSLLGAAALVGVAELARLLSAIRQRENLLLWARGVDSAGVGRRTAIDVAVAGGVGAALGLTVALVAAIASGVEATVGGSTIGVWMLALSVIAAGAAIAAFHAVRSGVPRLDRVPPRAGSRLALHGAVVLALVAATVSVWQLRLYGSPVTPSANGGAALDPTAVLAPALALAALVLSLVQLFPLLARLNERRVRGARVVPQLAARGVSRRLALLTAPLVLVALAAATLTYAASYSATWNDAFTQTTQLRVGSQFHAGSRVTGIPLSSQDAAAQATGVDLVAPLEMQPLSLGGPSGTIVGVAPEALASLATNASGLFDADDAAAAIRVDAPAPLLPEGSGTVSVVLATVGLQSPPQVSVYLSDAAGFLRSVPLVLDDATASPLTYTSGSLRERRAARRLASPTMRRSVRTSSRVGSSSAWGSRAPSPTNPASCSRTSRRVSSTAPMRRR